MNRKLYFNILDILQPEERELYLSYRRGQVSNLKTLASVVKKKLLYDVERANIHRLAVSIHRDRREVSVRKTEDVLYRAWVWGQLL